MTIEELPPEAYLGCGDEDDSIRAEACGELVAFPGRPGSPDTDVYAPVDDSATRAIMSIGSAIRANDFEAAHRALSGFVASRNSQTPGWIRISGDELFADLGPVPYVIPALDIAPGAVTLAAGAGFVGKSVTWQDALVSVATDGHVWGHFEVQARGRVAHLDFEQGRRLTQTRYRRIAAARGTDLELLKENLSFVIHPPDYIDADTAVDIYSRELEGHVMALIDPFRAAAPSVEENSSFARVPLDMLSRVSERTGCTIVVLHHARKPSGTDQGGAKASIRGSGAFFEAAQSVLVFTGEKGEPVKVTHEKAKISGVPADDFALVIEDVLVNADPKGGLRVRYVEANIADQWADDEATERMAEAMLAFIRRSPGCTKTEAKAGVRGNAQRKVAALDRLVRTGALRVDAAGKGRPELCWPL